MKARPIYLAAALLVFLSACAGGAGPTPTETLASPTATPAPVITVQSDGKEYTASNSTLVLTVECALPYIENAEGIPAYEAINSYYKNEMDVHMEGAASNLVRPAQDDYYNALEEGYEFHTYDTEMSFAQTLLNETRVSFSRMVYSYTGGVHGNLAVIGDTFDLTDGSRLSLGDLFSVPEEEYMNRLLGEMIALAAEDPDLKERLYEGFEQSIPEYFNPEHFYLTDTDLVIFYQPYDIAPWAGGVPIFNLPMEGLKDILK